MAAAPLKDGLPALGPGLQPPARKAAATPGRWARLDQAGGALACRILDFERAGWPLLDPCMPLAGTAAAGDSSDDLLQDSPPRSHMGRAVSPPKVARRSRFAARPDAEKWCVTALAHTACSAPPCARPLLPAVEDCCGAYPQLEAVSELPSAKTLAAVGTTAAAAEAAADKRGCTTARGPPLRFALPPLLEWGSDGEDGDAVAASRTAAGRDDAATSSGTFLAYLASRRLTRAAPGLGSHQTVPAGRRAGRQAEGLYAGDDTDLAASEHATRVQQQQQQQQGTGGSSFAAGTMSAPLLAGSSVVRSCQGIGAPTGAEDDQDASCRVVLLAVADGARRAAVPRYSSASSSCDSALPAAAAVAVFKPRRSVARVAAAAPAGRGPVRLWLTTDIIMGRRRLKGRCADAARDTPTRSHCSQLLLPVSKALPQLPVEPAGRVAAVRPAAAAAQAPRTTQSWSQPSRCFAADAGALALGVGAALKAPTVRTQRRLWSILARGDTERAAAAAPTAPVWATGAAVAPLTDADDASLRTLCSGMVCNGYHGWQSWQSWGDDVAGASPVTQL